jgi:arabinose-5-phosphate isomerase
MNTNIQALAQQTIETEASAVLGLKAFIDSDFEKIIQSIHEAKGRLIVSGIGKSAIVAQKIVATLNSTGTPALFMHAADAIHGDLGMITQEKEACPNNLAPTSSTTAQMVMGDVIAVCLMELNQFNNRDFAKFHPGGNLGKRLYLRVEDLSKANEKPSVLLTATLKEVIVEITQNRMGVTAVVDENLELKGIITDGDLRRMLEKTNDISQVCARDILSTNPITIHPEAMAVEALELLKKHNISQLVVAEKNSYKGIIHIHDLIREGIV